MKRRTNIFFTTTNHKEDATSRQVVSSEKERTAKQRPHHTGVHAMNGNTAASQPASINPSRYFISQPNSMGDVTWSPVGQSSHSHKTREEEQGKQQGRRDLAKKK